MADRSEIPRRPIRCPQCGYDLRGTLAADERQCAECGRKLSEFDVWVLSEEPDPRGRPTSLPPGRPSVSGRWLVQAALAVIAFVLIGLVIWSRVRGS